MILNQAIFKRDAFLSTRLPQEVKDQFEQLAAKKQVSKSEFLLELILKELSKEGIQIKAAANNPKKQ